MKEQELGDCYFDVTATEARYFKYFNTIVNVNNIHRPPITLRTMINLLSWMSSSHTIGIPDESTRSIIAYYQVWMEFEGSLSISEHSTA
jgi:hypothetical protein